MKLKKSIIIALFFCLMMIGSVSAASDTNDTLSSDVSEKVSNTNQIDKTTNTNDNLLSENTGTIHVTNKNNIISTNNEDNYKKADSYSKDDKISIDKNIETFTALGESFDNLRNKIENAPSGSTINLEYDQNYIQSDGDHCSFQIYKKTITINGNGHIINANGKSAIFHIYGSSDLTLENLKIINNNGDSVPIIENSGTLTIRNCIFNNNKADYGGAISNSGTLTITNTQFNQNTAQYGGAIHNTGTITITNTQFNQNTATNGGGAIYNTRMTSNNGNILHDGTLTITNTQFNQNTAKWGNAIAIAYGNANIHYCSFDNKNDIYCISGAVDLTDSHFKNPSSTSTSSTSKSSKTKVKTNKYKITKSNIKLKAYKNSWWYNHKILLLAHVKYKSGGNVDKGYVIFRVHGKKYKAKVNDYGYAHKYVKLPKVKKYKYSASFYYKGHLIKKAKSTVRVKRTYKTRIYVKTVKGFSSRKKKIHVYVRTKSGHKKVRGGKIIVWWGNRGEYRVSKKGHASFILTFGNNLRGTYRSYYYTDYFYYKVRRQRFTIKYVNRYSKYRSSVRHPRIITKYKCWCGQTKNHNHGSAWIYVN